MSHDMIKPRLNQHFCRATNVLSSDMIFMSRRSGVML